MSMPAIDAHLHLFPDEASGLLAQGGERLAGHAGVIDEVRACAAASGIERVLVLNTAIASVLRDFGMPEDQVWGNYVENNTWLCNLASEEPLIAVGLAADPTFDEAASAAHLRAFLDANDVRAIKIHPAIAHLMPDDAGYAHIYDLAVEAGVPVVSHGGSSEGAFYEAEVQYCAPANFEPVLGARPSLKLVVAHLCQPFYDGLVVLGDDYPNVYTDLSFVLGARLSVGDELRHTVRAFGVERVLFGTDFPYFDPADSLNVLADAGFTADEFEAITHDNAGRLFFET